MPVPELGATKTGSPEKVTSTRPTNAPECGAKKALSEKSFSSSVASFGALEEQ
jgi:hypothetical protein